jgi:dethiobiotin synthetase
VTHRSANIIVVTGTDTGVGKTTITRGLVRAMVRRGLRVRPLKWVETGCVRSDDGTLRGEDGWALARAAHREHEFDRVSPLRFALPAAPSVAARAEGEELSIERLRNALSRACTDIEWVVLEGAGGLMVPLTDERLFIDLCAELGLRRTVLVTRDGLGTVNHTLLSHEALHRRAMDVRAVVVNQRTHSEASDRSASLPLLRRWLHADTVLGPVPPRAGATDDWLADEVERIGLVERALNLTPN